MRMGGTSLCGFYQPIHGLGDFFWRGTGAVQSQFCQLVLGVFIPGPRGLLKPLPGGGFIAFRPDTVEEHPAKTVLNHIIVALSLQYLEPSEGSGEVPGRQPFIRGGSHAIPICLPQLSVGVRKTVDCRLFIELECHFIILFHAPAFPIQLGEGVLRVGTA